MYTQANSAHGSGRGTHNPPVGYALGNALADRFEQPQSAVVNYFGFDPHKVSLIASFVDDQRANGLDAIHLIKAFENTFDLRIPNDVVETIVTMRDTQNHFGR